MTTTIQTLKDQMAAKILSGKGQLIAISPDALKQAIEIMEQLKAVTGYDAANVTADDLELTQAMVDHFTTDIINGEVVDGVLRATSYEQHLKSLDEIKALKIDAPSCQYLSAFILIELMQEHMSFYR